MPIVAYACLVTCLTVVPAQETVSDNVDLVEVNHFYDDNAAHVFDQVIFYDWSSEQNRFQVRAWRLVKEPNQLPTRDWNTGGYQVIWNDGQFIRVVAAKAMRESWTQHDPEMRERQYFPKEYRRELLMPRVTSAEALP